MAAEGGLRHVHPPGDSPSSNEIPKQSIKFVESNFVTSIPPEALVELIQNVSTSPCRMNTKSKHNEPPSPRRLGNGGQGASMRGAHTSHVSRSCPDGWSDTGTPEAKASHANPSFVRQTTPEEGGSPRPRAFLLSGRDPRCHKCIGAEAELISCISAGSTRTRAS